jgi:plastocyanin
MLAALSVALFASTALANWSEHHQWNHKVHIVKVGGANLQYEPSVVHAKPGEKVKFLLCVLP